MLQAEHRMADILKVTNLGLKHHEGLDWVNQRLAGVGEEELNARKLKRVVAVLDVGHRPAIEGAGGDGRDNAL